MTNDKDNNRDTGRQQTAENNKPDLNPFKEPLPPENPQQQREQEIALEQQRKEALTERD
jgi:hypothetical protein